LGPLVRSFRVQSDTDSGHGDFRGTDGARRTGRCGGGAVRQISQPSSERDRVRCVRDLCPARRKRDDNRTPSVEELQRPYVPNTRWVRGTKTCNPCGGELAERPTSAAAPVSSNDCRRHHRLYRPDQVQLYHRTPRWHAGSALAQPTGDSGIPSTLDVPDTDRGVMMPRRKQTPLTRSSRPHQPGTAPENRTHRRSTTTPSQARRQLRTAAILRRQSPGSETEVRVQAGVGVRRFVDRIVVQRRIVHRVVVHRVVVHRSVHDRRRVHR
jgi:hypothetical protein